MELVKKDYGAGKIQQRALEILVFLDQLCRELGLTYFLAYGTLLGAVRHKGFIPWDDDIDVWMPREDFIKLREYLLTENKNERFILNEGEYKPEGDRPSELQMRILDRNAPIRRWYAEKVREAYLWIDIFALDSFPEEKKDQYFKKFKRTLFMYKIARCKNFFIPAKNFYGLMNYIVYTAHHKLHLFKHCLDEEKKKDAIVQAITRYQGLKSPEYFCYAAVYLHKPEKCFFKREWFEDPIELEFEGHQFFVPRNWDAVLKTLYNDYMTPPPEEARVYTHGVQLLDS